MNTRVESRGRNRIRGKKRIEIIQKFLEGEEDPKYEVVPTVTEGKYFVRPRKNESKSELKRHEMNEEEEEIERSKQKQQKQKQQKLKPEQTNSLTEFQAPRMSSFTTPSSAVTSSPVIRRAIAHVPQNSIIELTKRIKPKKSKGKKSKGKKTKGK